MVATWDDPLTQVHAVKDVNLLMFGYAHGRYLMARKTPYPDVEDEDNGIMPRAIYLAAEDEAKMDHPLRR